MALIIMLRRHQIFNVILAAWKTHGYSSTPRRGELLRLLAERNMKMSRTNLQQHLNGLVADGYISVEQGVITLRRRVPIADMPPVTCPD